ncbi:unnamed protein product [Lota lota]
MELCFKLATGLLLLFQAFHPTLLQDTTGSPGRTIDKSWLRAPANNALVSQMQSVEEPTVGYQELDSGGMASTIDNTNGSPFGSFFISSREDDENQEQNINGIHDGTNVITTPMLPTFPNKTDTEAKASRTSAAPKTELTTQSNPDTTVNNGSNSEGEFRNYTTVSSNYTDQMTPNVSTSPTFSDTTEFEETTLAPETHETNESRGETDPENWLNPTEETTSSEPNISKTTATEDGAAPSTPLPTHTTTTESPPPETTVNETVPVTMTTVVPGTTEKSNATDRDAASGESNTDRGLVSSSNRNKQNEAWAAILGTAVAVCVLALVIFVILKRKNQKAFSHRKLVEFSSDPVLRLDNSESLDSNYGRGAYYNPALQMTSIPSRYNGPNQDGFLD